MGVGVEVVIGTGLVAADNIFGGVAHGVVQIGDLFRVFFCLDLEIRGAADFGGGAVAVLLVVVIIASLSPTHLPTLFFFSFLAQRRKIFSFEGGFREKQLFSVPFTRERRRRKRRSLRGRDEIESLRKGFRAEDLCGPRHGDLVLAYLGTRLA